MDIWIRKTSADRHAVRVLRADGSEDSVVLNTRSFLHHDFAHFAIEIETPLLLGYWACVSGGATLCSKIESPEIWLAESLAGPIQTLMCDAAPVEQYRAILETRMADRASDDLAARVHERIRRLRGHWQATPYGTDMHIVWAP